MKNSNIYIKLIYNHINKHNHTHIHPHTLHSPQHSQCCVGEQNLGNRTRSLGANVVGSETGRGGWEGVSTAQALCLFSIVSLLFYL